MARGGASGRRRDGGGFCVCCVGGHRCVGRHQQRAFCRCNESKVLAREAGGAVSLCEPRAEQQIGPKSWGLAAARRVGRGYECGKKQRQVVSKRDGMIAARENLLEVDLSEGDGVRPFRLG